MTLSTYHTDKAKICLNVYQYGTLVTQGLKLDKDRICRNLGHSSTLTTQGSILEKDTLCWPHMVLCIQVTVCSFLCNDEIGLNV